MPQTNSQVIDILLRARDQASKAIDSAVKELGELDKEQKTAAKSADKLGDETKKAGKGVKSLGDDVKKTNPPVSRFSTAMAAAKVAAAGFVGYLVGGTVVNGIKGFSSSIIQAASTAENYQVRLNRLLGGVKEGSRLFDDMSKYAGSVAFSYEEIMGAATQLSGVMKGGVDEINKWIPLIGDVAAASGLGIQDATSQIVRMYSAGAASADLFRERGVLAMLGFQSGVSYTAEETRKKLIEAWESPTSQFRDAAGDLSNTWNGILSMMGDAWFQFRTQVADAGFFNYMKSILTEILVLIQGWRNTGAMKGFAQNISVYMVGSIEVLIKWIALAADAFYGWELIIKNLQIAFAAMIQGVTWGLSQIVELQGKVLDISADMIEKLLTAIGPIAVKLKLIPEALLRVGDAAVKNLRNAAGATGGITASIDQMSQNWKEVKDDTKDQLNTLINQQSYLNRADKLIERIRDGADKIGEAMAKGSGNAKKLGNELKKASALALAGSKVTRLKADTQLALKELEDLYKKNEITIDEYYDKRLQKAREVNDAEIALQKSKLAAAGTSDVDKRLKIEDDIYAIQKRFALQEIQLAKEKENAKRDFLEKYQSAEGEFNEKRIAAAQAFADQKARIEGLEGAGPGAGLQEEFRKEQLDLQTKQAAELATIQDFNDAELELLRQRKTDEADINKVAFEQEARMYDLYMQQVHERELQAADQHRRVMEMRMRMSAEVAGNAAKLFTELYDIGGKKSKEFFYLAKAAAIAEATINTAQAITKALAQGGFYGTAMAVIVGALGAVQIAKIASQSLAQGGLVHGYSPHPKADNIAINATAGEYMQPVSAVRYYGIDAMNAIRNKVIPRNLLSQFSVPSMPHYSSRTHYAMGGEIQPQNGQRSAASQAVNITNIAGDDMIQRYLNSGEGKRSIVNIIGEKAFEVKQVLANG